MSRNIFGWDLPPSCSTSDILGNRPEDEKWEAMINGFWDKKRGEAKDEILANASTNLTELIDEAIEYGIGIGKEEQQAIEQETKFYEEQAKEYQKEKSDAR